MTKRCPWGFKDPGMLEYHDKEWGVPLHDDKKLFELLILEGFQAGLSWSTVLRKRQAFREAFDNFDPQKVMNYTDKDIERLINNPLIIRNKLKILAAIGNARCFKEIQREFGSFNNYIWRFVNDKPRINHFKNFSEMPAETEESKLISEDLRKRGFRFVGSTICYAFMQAAGLVNDHFVDCFRWKEIQLNYDLKAN